MRIVLATLALGLCLAEPARAEIPAPIWQGFYLGVEGNTRTVDVTAQSLTSTAGGSQSSHHGGAGLYGGYNWQNGPWVFGIETDWTHGFNSRNDIDQFSARSRIGYAIGPALVYGTAGIATQNAHLRVTKSNPLSTQSLISERQHTGFIVGGGVEAMVATNVSLRGEALYFDGGRETYNYAFAAPLKPSQWTAELTEVIYRVGVTYSFK